MALRYAFMGSPPIAVTILDRLLKDYGRPSLVVTQPARSAGRGKHLTPTAVEAFARSQNLEVIPSENVNADATVQAIRSTQPDVILVAAFGQILKADILKLPRLTCLNVHASLLPKYRGAAPVQRAIWNGDTTTGITIQKMAPKLDTGDILLQRSLIINPAETSGELLDRLAILGGEAACAALKQMESGKSQFAPQDESKASDAPKIQKQDAMIRWKLPAQQIQRQIRALQPWPVAETLWDKQKLKILRADLLGPLPGKKIAEIETDRATHLYIQCGQAALALTEVQLENRKRLPIQDFLKGYRGEFPQHLGDP